MSITSMNARMGMAEKLDVQQLTKAVQDGTVPSYIGIPLIQQKMQESQQARAMAQPKAPPIAQQVMQQAMQGVPALPSNMPEEYAQGGILSYAGGGDLYDDEDYDPEDEAQADALMQGEALMDELLANPEMYAGRSVGIDYNEAPNPQVEYHRTPTTEEVKVSKGKPNNFESVAIGKSKSNGVDENLLKHILHKESRGQRYDKEGNLLTSSKGAMGEMQVMPGTVRDPGFGVAPARSNNPDELRRVGEDYAKALLSKYRDPKLAAIAYNWGPGNTDKWLSAGADVSRLPQETRGYIQGMAQGGITGLAGGGAIHFDKGDLVKERESEIMRALKTPFRAIGSGLSSLYGGRAGMPSDTDYTASGDLAGAIMGEREPTIPLEQSDAETARLLRQNAMARGVPIDRTEPSVPAPLAPSAPSTPFAGNETPDLVTGGYGASGSQAAAPAETEGSAKASPTGGIEELLAKREAGVAKQRDIDNYMALLSAGLGMLGGTSPHAAANIGQGAQAGIKTYGDSATRRAAEENAILSGRLGAYKYAGTRAQADAMMQLRKDLQKEQMGYNRERLAQTGKEHLATLEQRKEAKQLDLIKNEQDRALATAAKLVGDNPAALSMSDSQKAEAVRKMADSLLMQNKMYRTSHVNVYGADPFADMGGGGGGTRLKFDAQGQQIK